jgi:streptogramin lyase
MLMLGVGLWPSPPGGVAFMERVGFRSAGQNSSAKAPRPPAEIPFERLKPDAVIAIDLEQGAVADADAIWVPQRAARAIVRIDAKSNRTDPPITVPTPPCASVAIGFDSVWVPTCEGEGGGLVRVSVKHGNVSATMPLPVADPQGGIATTVGSVWMLTSAKGVLSRIDPDTNAPVAEAYVAGKPSSVVAGEDALWVTSETGNVVTRINPHTNAIVETIKVGPRPGRIVVGEGAVWTLNRGDGSVSRIDARSNKLVTTIAVGEPVASGDLAAGEGSVWISAPGVPITRIDPASNRVVQRFAGAGGGAIVIAHGSVWVAAGSKVTWRVDPKLVAAMRP